MVLFSRRIWRYWNDIQGKFMSIFTGEKREMKRKYIVVVYKAGGENE